MIKKEKGITLTILVFTIVVMLILAGVVMNINTSLNKTADVKTIMINMQMIETKATKINADNVVDLNIESLIVENSDSETAKNKYTYVNNMQLPGEHLEYTSGSIIANLLAKTNKISQYLSNDANYYWYMFDKEHEADLKEKIGADIRLENDEVYIINYRTLEIAYGKKTTNNQLIGIKNKYNEEIFFYNDLKLLRTEEISN